jgi:hypothetical protein
MTIGGKIREPDSVLAASFARCPSGSAILAKHVSEVPGTHAGISGELARVELTGES